MADEKRRERRVASYAKVISLNDSVPGYVRDVSASGFKLAFLKPPEIREGEPLPLRVIPEESLGIPPFQVDIEVSWQHQDPVFTCVGGKVEPQPGAESSLDRLIGYYSTLKKSSGAGHQ